MEIMTVEAELRLPAAAAKIARFHVDRPSDYVFEDRNEYWLDLCLTSRANQRGRYLDASNAHHFKQVGNLLLIPAGHACEFRVDGASNTASIVCQMAPDLFRTWFDDDLEWTGRRLDAGLDVSNGKIRSLLRSLADEIQHPGLASEALTELIFGQIAIELGRHCAAMESAQCSGGLAPWRLRRIDERLMELGDAPALGELATLCNVSVRQLTRGFRTSRGCTIGAYVAEKRAEHAKRLLATDKSLKAVAHAMGFTSQSAFTYAFRRSTGTTPRQYRRKVLGAG